MRCRRMMFPASIWIKSNERAAPRSRGTILRSQGMPSGAASAAKLNSVLQWWKRQDKHPSGPETGFAAD